MSKDTGGQAFPRPYYPGMTLRDYFAGQALMGLLADPTLAKKVNTQKEQLIAHGKFSENISRSVYSYADAMIAERNK